MALVRALVAAAVSVSCMLALALVTVILRDLQWAWWPLFDGVRPVVLAAAWAMAAAVVAAPGGWLIRRCVVSCGALAPQAAWVAGTLAVYESLGWKLVPWIHDIARAGPALGMWLLVGTLSLSLAGSREGPGGWATVPARALTVWAVGYGTMWGLLTVMMVLSSLGGLPQEIDLALGVSALLLAAATPAVAASCVGPAAFGPQCAALIVASAATALCVPGVFGSCVKLVHVLYQDPVRIRVLAHDLELILAATSTYTMTILLGTLLIWLRARHHRRMGTRVT